MCDKIERDFANVLNTKILPQRYNISLTRDELTIIKKFLIISIFRFKYSKEKLLEDGVYDETIQMAEMSSFNINLSKILSCNNEEELFNLRKDFYKSIANLMLLEEKINKKKIANICFLGKVVNEILGAYLGFLCSNYSKEHFVITDIGSSYYFGKSPFSKLIILQDLIYDKRLPVELKNILFPIAFGTSAMDYCIFPVASNMAVICWSPFYKLYELGLIHEYTVSQLIGFGSKDTISSPRVTDRNGKRKYTYSVKQITSNDLHHLNYILLEEADKYIAFADYRKIKPSVEYAEKQTLKKRDFSALLTLNPDSGQ